MKREVFAFSFLSSLSFLSSSASPAQVSLIRSPSYSGTGGTPAVGVRGASHAFYPSAALGPLRSAQHRAKPTPKVNFASYGVPANFASAVDYSSEEYNSAS